MNRMNRMNYNLILSILFILSKLEPPFVTGLTDLWPIVGLSLRVSVSAVLLSTLVGVPLGAWLGLTRSRLRWSLSALVYTGMGLPPVVAAGFGRSISEVGAVYMVGGNIKDHTRVLTTTIMMETNKGDFALALALG